MASGITLQSTNNSVVTLKNVGTTTGTTEVTVPNRNMTMGSEITLDTAQATTSGTFKDFTIPSGVKRVTVMFDGVSTNGTSHLLVRLGDSGGIESTGYASSSGYYNVAGQNQTDDLTGLMIWNGSATNSMNGIMHIESIAVNKFISSHSLASSPSCISGGGSKQLSAELTTVRITTVNGTDTFDTGSVNVSWEF